jgi:hypothetical protein
MHGNNTRNPSVKLSLPQSSKKCYTSLIIFYGFWFCPGRVVGGGCTSVKEEIMVKGVGG